MTHILRYTKGSKVRCHPFFRRRPQPAVRQENDCIQAQSEAILGLGVPGLPSALCHDSVGVLDFKIELTVNTRSVFPMVLLVKRLVLGMFYFVPLVSAFIIVVLMMRLALGSREGIMRSAFSCIIPHDFA